MTNTLLEQLKGYENKWVAILEPEKNIVGSGDNAVEAKRDAEKKGYKNKNVVLLGVLPFKSGYVPLV
jgi:hypothetical protein